ncbi:PhzF family phenazine biosynthesis protein [Salsipaludibacter albus]|uniref:PhzF family phenazine biosynthesis protein n=1 Tax=Salsipaludibacter albus TaxID=2849650 RepID=UPI001EE46604|nr:PhzF family phenazine biosynthesis isomerase [Salsipaludibacter albus]MBY5162311.1 PhzF family phenazine biosynthesis isomerase [Salsipaludibacter albus]
MSTHSLAWVDAFTDRAFGGNPCAVVFDADDVDVDTRIAFTRETRLSECAFVVASSVADVGARYYVASGEIPMAGHPTIATVTALLDAGVVELVDDVASFTLEVGAGVLPIEVDGTADGPPRITMQQLRPTFGRSWEPELVAPLVGLRADDFRATPRTVSTGTPFLVSPLVSHDALRRARLDVDALLAFHEDHDADFFEPFLTAMGGATPDGDVFSRLLLTPPEPPEDPFTGSATGCLGAWLWAEGEIDGPRFVAEQGHDMDRPGRADVEVLGPRDDIAGVLVGGTGVVLVRGQVTLPD